METDDSGGPFCSHRAYGALTRGHDPRQRKRQKAAIGNGLDIPVSAPDLTRALGTIDAAFGVYDRAQRLIACNASYTTMMQAMGAAVALGRRWDATASDIINAGGQAGRSCGAEVLLSRAGTARCHLCLSQTHANGTVFYVNGYPARDGGFVVFCVSNVEPPHAGGAFPRAEAATTCSRARAEKSKLSPREREVLSLLARGLSMKEVGRTLAVTPRTVAFHKYRLMRANNLRNSTELMALAVAEGLVTLSPATKE